jgi:hypothetical protein
MDWSLAQLNIARMKFDADAPQMADFNAALDPVNGAADRSPGFIWRLESDDADSSGDRVFDDPNWLVNLTLWSDLDSLLTFVRSEIHLAIMKRRREWFEPVEEETMVLWWIPAGTLPSVPEAQRRLERIRAAGPGRQAFSFNAPFPPPGRGESQGQGEMK